MVLWGLFTTCVVAAHSLGALMALRFLTGAAEAFIQGTLIYLSFWYRYDELATRGALYDGCGALAGAFNGIVSYHIQTDLDGRNGWRAWRCKSDQAFTVGLLNLYSSQGSFSLREASP